MRSHEHRRPAQPLLERAVEKRVGPAMYEGGDRPLPAANAEVCPGRERGLLRKVRPDQPLELVCRNDLHVATRFQLNKGLPAVCTHWRAIPAESSAKGPRSVGIRRRDRL